MGRSHTNWFDLQRDISEHTEHQPFTNPHVGVYFTESPFYSIIICTCECSGCTENEAVWKAVDGDRISSVDFDDDVRSHVYVHVHCIALCRVNITRLLIVHHLALVVMTFCHLMGSMEETSFPA